jgi:hypothetical protein
MKLKSSVDFCNVRSKESKLTWLADSWDVYRVQASASATGLKDERARILLFFKWHVYEKMPFYSRRKKGNNQLNFYRYCCWWYVTGRHPIRKNSDRKNCLNEKFRSLVVRYGTEIATFLWIEQTDNDSWKAVFRNRDILVRIWIQIIGSVTWLSDPNQYLWLTDQDANPKGP